MLLDSHIACAQPLLGRASLRGVVPHERAAHQQCAHVQRTCLGVGGWGGGSGQGWDQGRAWGRCEGRAGVGTAVGVDLEGVPSMRSVAPEGTTQSELAPAHTAAAANVVVVPPGSERSTRAPTLPFSAHAARSSLGSGAE